MEDLENFFDAFVMGVLADKLSSLDYALLYTYMDHIKQAPGQTTEEKYNNWSRRQTPQVRADHTRLTVKAGGILARFNTETLGFSSN